MANDFLEFRGNSIISTGINPVNIITISYAPQIIPKSALSFNLSFLSLPLNPYTSWLLGGIRNGGKELPGFSLSSKSIGLIVFPGFILGTLKIPIIFQAFSFLSTGITSNELQHFQFISDIVLSQFNLLFGRNSFQTIDSFVINLSDLNIQTNATAESALVSLFKRWSNQSLINIEIQNLGISVGNRKIIYTYWMLFFDTCKDENENLDSSLPLDPDSF